MGNMLSRSLMGLPEQQMQQMQMPQMPMMPQMQQPAMDPYGQQMSGLKAALMMRR